MRGATAVSFQLLISLLFQSTLLMRGATRGGGTSSSVRRISIHAPHARSDLLTVASYTFISISIHAPHARSDKKTDRMMTCIFISIHAPHARSDVEKMFSENEDVLISIHAPHARSDALNLPQYFTIDFAFQSTLLMRGATWPISSEGTMAIFQSTLLMRGATSCRQ